MTIILKKMLKLFTCFSLSRTAFSARFIHMKKTSNSMKSLSKFYKPKSKNQELYFNFLNEEKIKILFVVGPAGTGKTLLACNNAIKELSKKTYDKIVITRPIVTVEEELGFLPGNMIKKMDPWTRPLFDVFLEFYSQKDLDSMIQNNIIEISPLAYMRGRTFKNAFIIADEMQNSSPNQMLMLTTRIGSGSKMVITGDLNQTDRNSESGLADFIRKFKLYENENNFQDGIKLVELTNKDIEREPIIAKILDIYNVEKNHSSISKSVFYQDKRQYKNDTEYKIGDEHIYDIDVCDLYKNNEDINADAALIPKRYMMNPRFPNL